MDVKTQDYVDGATKYVDLTTEYQTFTIDFTADKDYNSIRVSILLGKINATAANIDVTFDSVTITKV